MQNRKIQRYGWLPDLPDPRDLVFALAAPVSAQALPLAVDLERLFPPCYDQAQVGSCTANALAAMVQFEQRRQKLTDFMPSRLFIYYNERVIEGTVASDSGAMLRDGIKSIASQGVCREELWPYDPSKFTHKPAPFCYTRATLHKALKYQAIRQDLGTLHAVLASGQPFVFGFTAFEEFEGDAIAQTGVMSMPSASSKPIGGHAVVCVGYDAAQRTFKVRNSWGADFGDHGHFYMPEAYMLDPNLADDFWVITLLGEKLPKA